ncbi:Hypothetical protein PHPALM_13471 [Phytophthora palmivora]|uniref:Uncharacterized protein n=1 Tax=Phytophthora palmivora TaxID=4796 RepID=A0A2P4XXE9_9STRA|nr:Hypothetical protein PHPALM_13471 [Phytophthora palmivora]
MFFVTLEEAAKNGDLTMVKWLCDVRGEWSPYAAVLAASGGHLDVLKWLRGNIFSSSPSASMDDAAANGHLHVLKWLQINSGYATPAAMNKAAGNGHLDIVKWLHKTRREGCTITAMDTAAANGHLEIVKCERSEGCTAKAFVNATTADELEILQWLFEHYRDQFGHDRLQLFALGKFYTLQWLKQESILEDLPESERHFE